MFGSTLLRRPLRRVAETCEHARPPLVSPCRTWSL